MEAHANPSFLISVVVGSPIQIEIKATQNSKLHIVPVLKRRTIVSITFNVLRSGKGPMTEGACNAFYLLELLRFTLSQCQRL